MVDIKEKLNKKNIIIAIIISAIIIITTVIILIVNRKDDSFRNIRIGMDKETVFIIEKTQNDCNVSKFKEIYNVYYAEFDDYIGDIVYSFDESDKLDSIMFTMDYSDESDYFVLRNILKQKYGRMIGDNKEIGDGTIRTEYKCNSIKYTLSYEEDKDEVVIYIQKYSK